MASPNASNDGFLSDANIWIPKGVLGDPVAPYPYTVVHSGVLKDMTTSPYGEVESSEEEGTKWL